MLLSIVCASHLTPFGWVLCDDSMYFARFFPFPISLETKYEVRRKHCNAHIVETENDVLLETNIEFYEDLKEAEIFPPFVLIEESVVVKESLAKSRKIEV